MKTCKICNELKPKSEYKGRSMCVPCKNAIERSKAHKRKDKILAALNRTEKICISCNVMLPLREFPYNKKLLDGRHGKCKACTSVMAKYYKSKYPGQAAQRAKEWYNNNKEKAQLSGRINRNSTKKLLIDILGGACTNCGILVSPETPPCCFDFHHEGDKKEHQMAKFSSRTFPLNDEVAMIELAKCVVLCSNCHRKHHWMETWEGDLF